MGYYIETKASLNKADQLLQAHPEIKETDFAAARFDRTGAKVLVCVVQNGPFDAAAVCYSENEFLEFGQHDGRPKRWLELPRALAVKLCPTVESRLPVWPTVDTEA